MMKVPDIFKTKKQTFSFELFPPKTETGYDNLLSTIKDFSAFKPDFISCTYGAAVEAVKKPSILSSLFKKTSLSPRSLI